MTDFAYVRRGLRLDEIESYIQSYDFGPVLPDFGVIHHSAIPAASWAHNGNEALWDDKEVGLNSQQIYDKRLRQVDNAKNFYANKGWSAGPHAFIDERYVWLMTPMNQIGIHAKWANSFRSHGALHYSIGVEMIGDFTKARWHPQQAQLAGVFWGALQRKLGTFTLDYLYADPASRPGMVGTGDDQACAHPERLRWGGLSSHRDYNKPACPGDMITNDYYIATIRQFATIEQAAARVDTPKPRWRVRDDIDFAAVRVAANKAAAPATIPAAEPGNDPAPVQLAPGWVIASDLQVGNWLHIQEPAPWGYSAASNFISVSADTPIGPPR